MRPSDDLGLLQVRSSHYNNKTGWKFNKFLATLFVGWLPASWNRNGPALLTQCFVFLDFQAHFIV